VSPTAISILSLLIGDIKEKSEKKELIRKIQSKFKQVPNSSLLKVWLQRLYLKIDKTIEYDELICKKVIDNNEKVWNSEWLNGGLKRIIDNTPIIQDETIKKLKVKVSKKEIKKIIRRKRYTYE
ncbi:MAG: hypothetical protein P9M03_13120, partial [Candidatus Theseobacter exili]|nr:hypothetical protein [Candidatus Theseobacter exili]